MGLDSGYLGLRIRQQASSACTSSRSRRQRHGEAQPKPCVPSQQQKPAVYFAFSLNSSVFQLNHNALCSEKPERQNCSTRYTVTAKIAGFGRTIPTLREPFDMAPTLPQFNPARLRSYIFRVPLFTRIILLLITLFWILEFQTAWNITQWGALVPLEVNLGTSTSTVASPYETSHT